jgi:hypothetical protein
MKTVDSMGNELFARMYQQNHANIKDRNVWHYLIDSSIGQINIVQYEATSKEITEFFIPHDHGKAEKKFDSICKAIISGKL